MVATVKAVHWGFLGFLNNVYGVVLRVGVSRGLGFRVSGLWAWSLGFRGDETLVLKAIAGREVERNKRLPPSTPYFEALHYLGCPVVS